MWQELLRNKYKDKTIGSCVKKPTDSHFWKSLMNIRDSLLEQKDGSQTRFWYDTWLGNKPLKDKFPSLFSIVRSKQDSVAQVLRSVSFNISFRRNLVGANLRAWYRIVASVLDINWSEQKDVFVWSLELLQSSPCMSR